MTKKKKSVKKSLDKRYIKASLFERQMVWVQEMLNDSYSVPQIAEFLGIERQTLYDRLNKFTGVTTVNPKDYKVINKSKPDVSSDMQASSQTNGSN